MKNIGRFITAVIVIFFLLEHAVIAQTKLPDCQGNEVSKWSNCYGATTYTSGNKYIGSWKDGKRNGTGTFTFTNGEKYVGEYKDDKREGQGTYTIPNGDQYIGEHKNGKYDGQGTYTEANGNKYIGEWKNDFRNGQGTYIWADGNKYVGEWKDNFRDGQGTLFLSNGNKITGNFKKNGNLNGQGVLSYSNGNKYDGEFKDGFQNGQGTYTYANGEKYVGEFKEDKRHGYGKEFNSNGSIAKEGQWKNGTFLESDRNLFANNTNPSNLKSVAKNDEQAAYIDLNRKIVNSDGSITIETVHELSKIGQDGAKSIAKSYTFYCSEMPKKNYLEIENSFYSGPLKTGSFIKGYKVNAGKRAIINSGSIADSLFSAACNFCPPENNIGHASLDAAIRANKEKSASCVRGVENVNSNLALTTSGPNEARYEIITIKGYSPQTQELLIQIFNTGIAAVSSNGGGRMGYQYKGNGVFVDDSDVIKIDENSRIVNVNGNNVKNVEITRKDPPNQANMAFGKKLNFPGPLDSAKDRTELVAACVSATKAFISQSRGTAFNTQGAPQWSSCMSGYMYSEKNFSTHVNNWDKKFNDGSFHPQVLGIFFERCSREFVVMTDASGRCR